MKTLSEIVKLRANKEQELSKLTEKFKSEKSKLEEEINSLKGLEIVGGDGFRIDLIQIAESLITVTGNPYGITSDVSKFGSKVIAEEAIVDIANGCKQLCSQYFGNKRYEGFYQRCDCEYGYGPRHGSICDRIELRNPKTKLTKQEQDACIYYLKNYQEINFV